MRETSIAATALTALRLPTTVAAEPGETAYLCVTCGTQFAETPKPPEHCPICEDERQYVGPDGQEWTTLERPSDDAQEHHQEGRGGPLLDQHRAEVRHRPAGVPDPDAAGQPPVGLRRADRRRDDRADQASWAGSPRSRSRTRTITRRWSSGVAPSATHRFTSTRPSGPG